MQCRGQVEGGVAQALGAALYEEVALDGEGAVATRTFRNYHIPACGDVPDTRVLFAETDDAVGPLGAKSMSESPFNPVAAALGNAIRDATGARLTATPFAPDRIFRAVAAACDQGERRPVPIRLVETGGNSRDAVPAIRSPGLRRLQRDMRSSQVRNDGIQHPSWLSPKDRLTPLREAR